MHLTSEAEGRTEDVPGAILTREKTEEWTEKQLQRWLLCHRTKTTGKKTFSARTKASTRGPGSF